MMSIPGHLRKVLLPAEKKYFLLLTSLLFFGALLELVGISSVIPVIALFVNPGLFEQNAALKMIRSLCSGVNDRTFLILLCTATLVFFVVKNLLLFLINWLQVYFCYTVAGRAGERLIVKYLRAPYVFHMERSSAKQLELIRDTRSIFNDMLNGTMMILLESMVAAVILTAIFIMAPVTALSLTAVMFLICGGIYLVYRKMTAQASEKLLSAAATSNEFILDSTACIREIKLSGRLKLFVEHGRRIISEAARTECRVFAFLQLSRFAIEGGVVALGMGTIIIMVLIGINPETIALKLSFIALGLMRLMPSFSRIHYYVSRAKGTKETFEKVCSDLENVMPETDDLDGKPEPVISFEKAMRFENISFAWGDHAIVSGLTLEVPARTSLALSGPTGCGKSTLIDIAAGLLKPSSGRITADGVDISENPQAWRKLVGCVPQTISIVSDTVCANVAFGVPPEQIDRRRVEECLKTAQAWNFVNSLEHGMDTMLGERGENISGGQRQRIGIARALYPNPKLLLFDEATSALDSVTEAELVSALESLSGKVTMIIAAHRFSTIENCTQIYRFS